MNDPKRLRVRDRVIVVLKGITMGDAYFTTPYDVLPRFVTIDEAGGFPLLMVTVASGGEFSESMDGMRDEIFLISVDGYVDDSTNSVQAMERFLRDIRKALYLDAMSGAAGGLGDPALCSNFKIAEPPDTDEGTLSLINKAFFSQRFSCNISGIITNGD